MNFRTIVETSDGNKYYPKFITFNSTFTYPWSAQVANIVINTNVTSSTAVYIPPIRNDDIVRFQVNESNNTFAYHDIFEGRITSMSSSFGKNNLTTINCRGHDEELLYRSITADYNSSSVTTGTMLTSLTSSYLTRLTGAAAIDTTGCTNITSYNVKKDTKYLGDIVKEFEALEFFTYMFKVVPAYDSGGKLSDCAVSWQALSSTASTTIQIIEGTPRLISATFTDSIEQVVEDVTVYGSSGSPQKVGTSIDTSPDYNTRYHITTDTTLATDSLCSDLADAIRDRFGSSIIRGSVRILGAYGLAVGDLVYVKIPSLEINGATIDGNYRINRLSNDVTASGWFIDLDLGEIIQRPADLLAGFHTGQRLIDSQFID